MCTVIFGTVSIEHGTLPCLILTYLTNSTTNYNKPQTATESHLVKNRRDGFADPEVTVTTQLRETRRKFTAESFRCNK